MHDEQGDVGQHDLACGHLMRARTTIVEDDWMDGRTDVCSCERAISGAEIKRSSPSPRRMEPPNLPDDATREDLPRREKN